MSEVKLCPVCTGSGIVDKGFYERTSDTQTSAGGTELCRACQGRGYIIISGAELEAAHDLFSKSTRAMKRE